MRDESATVPPAGPRPGPFDRLVALGALRGAVVLTGLCVLASLLISVAVTAALGRLSLMGLAISIAVPTLIVPPTWYPFLRVSQRLQEAESRLRASEERHRTILERMSEAYIEVDRDGRLVFGNEALSRITGCDREELARGRIAEFAPPGAAERLRAAAARPHRAGPATEICEYPIVAKDGTPRTVEATFSPLLEGDAAAGGYRAVIRDVSERVERERARKEHEEQLRRSRKMEALGTLAGGVAHDLNNILCGIVGYPDLLLLDCPEESPMRSALTAIKDSGERAARIVQDLLTRSRRGVVATRVVDLNQVVAAYLTSPEHARLEESRPSVRVKVDLDPGLFTIVGSETHLATSVMNLVLNAFEAMEGAGAVSLSTANRYLDRPLRGYDQVKAGDYVTLTVTDTGSGIAPEDLERVFEPFYTRKVVGRSGTGLGLAVVWGIVKDHEGYVDITSEVGKGTT